jgi:predicted O-methyltransferase YrrM
VGRLRLACNPGQASASFAEAAAKARPREHEERFSACGPRAFDTLTLGGVLAVLLVALASAHGPAQAPDVPSILADIKKRDTGQLAVSEEDGRFLRVLVASSGARRALEIGGASGYSAIWIGLGLRDTGGKLVTIEYDAARAKELAANIRRAGLIDVVQVVSGDAFKEIPRVPGTFDFVFLDAWKKDYKRFLDLVYPRLDPGGLFIAHNVVNKRNEMEDFLAAVQTHPSLWTTIVSPSSEGMSVSLKRR